MGCCVSKQINDEMSNKENSVVDKEAIVVDNAEIICDKCGLPQSKCIETSDIIKELPEHIVIPIEYKYTYDPYTKEKIRDYDNEICKVCNRPVKTHKIMLTLKYKDEGGFNKGDGVLHNKETYNKFVSEDYYNDDDNNIKNINYTNDAYTSITLTRPHKHEVF